MRSFALRKNLIRGGAAVLATSAIVLAVAAPGSAATTPLAYSDASGLTLSLLGSPITTGTATSTTDGKTTTTCTTGATVSLVNGCPGGSLVQALAGQSLIPSTGVVVQNAKATMSGTDGVSQACAGLAGPGGSAVAVGNGDCIKGGQQLRLDAGSVALSPISLASSGILKPISDQLANLGVLGCGSGSTTNPLSALDITKLLSLLGLSALPTGVTSCSSLVNSLLGGLTPLLTTVSQAVGLHLNLGAVSAWCTATPTTVAGNGNVAGASLVATLAGKDITVLNLPVNPAPNTHVLTNLSSVVDAVSAGLKQQIDTELAGATSPLSPIITQVLGAINTNIVQQVQGQLAPLENNVLDAVLNAQSKTAAPHPTISVTALNLKLLPILGSSDIALRVGKVDCGPNYTANNVVPPTNCSGAGTCTPATCQSAHNCPPPNKVTSGLAAGYLPTGPLGMALLGLTVVAAAGAGVTAGARALRKSA